MSKPTPIVCYYSALNPENQLYSEKIPNDDSTSPYQYGRIAMQTYPLFNDNNIEIGLLKSDGNIVTYKNNSYYENRIWTAFFYDYGSVSFPLGITNSGPYFEPGSLFIMPILYCSGNDIYNQTGTVEFLVYGNDAKSRSITIKFD